MKHKRIIGDSQSVVYTSFSQPAQLCFIPDIFLSLLTFRGSGSMSEQADGMDLGQMYRSDLRVLCQKTRIFRIISPKYIQLLVITRR